MADVSPMEKTKGVLRMTSLEIAQRVDAKGLSCPMPIVKTAQAMKAAVSGALIEVLATDPGSVKDFDAWSKMTGNPLVESSVEAGVYRFVLRKK